MYKLREYIQELGYKQHGEFSEYGFSSVAPNGCWHVFRKGDSEFTFGLGEKGFPPTLLHPVPNMRCKTDQGKIFITQARQAEVIDWLSKNTAKYCFDELIKGVTITSDRVIDTTAYRQPNK